MKTRFIAAMILALFLFSILLSYSDPIHPKAEPAASQGDLDLSSWHFGKKDLLSLNGEWACYDGQLLTPADFHGTGTQVPKLSGYMELTAGRTGESSSKFVKAKGVRTYRLIINHMQSENTFGLTVDNINMCSRVYVNGALLGSSGVPSLIRDKCQEKTQAYSVYFPIHSSQAEIILQTVNYDYPFQGTQYTLRIGLQNAVRFSSSMTYAIELCGAAISFLIAFFYLCLYLECKKGRYYLSICSGFLGLSIAFLTYGYKLIYFLFPSIPFELFAKLQTLCLPAVFISIMECTRSDNKTFLPKWYTYLVYIVVSVFSVVVLLTPYSIYVYLTGIWDAFMVLALLYYLWMIFKRYYMISNFTDKIRHLFEGFSLAAFTIDCANNFLYDFSWVPSKRVGSTAICFFFLLSVATMAMRFAESMRKTARNELAFLQAQIKPHFIYNTINTIISFCYSDSERAADLLANFSKYLRFAFDVDNRTQKIPLSKEIDIVRTYVKIEQARFGNKIQAKYNIDEDLLKMQIPPLLIQPLVENAIRHGLRGKQSGGLVTVSVKKAGNMLTITISDTGIGMTPEQLNCLKKHRNVNGGVGIDNLCQRVNRLENANIDFNSTEKMGTTVTITFKSTDKKSPRGGSFLESHCHRR